MQRSIQDSRILVVDDSKESLKQAVDLLTEQTGRPYTARNGEDALRLLRQEPDISLVLLDFHMQGLKGPEVCAHMRRIPAHTDTPVIIVTSSTKEEDIVRSFEAGAVDLIRKPYSRVEFLARVSTQLKLRSSMKQVKALQKEEERLLHATLPERVAKRMLAGEINPIDNVPQATVIFTDLVGFTDLATHYKPDKFAQVLTDMYDGYDRIARNCGLEKVKTIGDAYVAVAGIDQTKKDHALQAVLAAMGLCNFTKELAGRLRAPVNVRIGIDTGPVVAGVIGADRLAWDIWGQTVNNAAHLEASGLPGRIQISEHVKSQLPDHVKLEERSGVTIKGKGETTTWLIEALKVEDAPDRPVLIEEIDEAIDTIS